jgi:4-hydroxy-tetrahydrodipicolinate synthase
MSGVRLRGVVPPVVTPLTAHGRVDVAGLRRVTRRMVDAGVHGLFALGSSGEAAYLAAAERRLVLDTVIDEAAGTVPVLAGCIEMTQARVIEAVRVAEDAGAAAIVATPPFYAKNDVHEIADHFRGIDSATALDLWAYDIPVRVHSKLPADLLIELGSAGVLAGVKDSSGDDVGFRRLVAMNVEAGRPLSVFTGHEVVVDSMLMLGADGAVPGLANVDPVSYVALWNAAEAQDCALAQEIQANLARLFEIVFVAQGRSADAAGVGAFKVALQHLGVIEHAGLSAPVKSLSLEDVGRIAGIVDALRVAGDLVESDGR